MKSTVKKKPGAVRKQEIIAVASRLCREEGLKKLSLRGVAKRVGISAPSIYEYFKNKDELIDTLRELERSRLAIALTEKLDISKSVKDRLFDLSWAYIEFAQEQPDSFQLLFSMPTTRTSIDMDPEEGSPYLPLVTTCREAIESGETAPHIKDPEILAFQLWASMHGIASLRSCILRDVDFDMKPMIDGAISQSLTSIFA